MQIENPDLESQLNSILALESIDNPEEVVKSLVLLSEQAPEKYWDDVLKHHQDIIDFKNKFTNIYYDYILSMELNEIEMISEKEFPPGTDFPAVASHAAVTSYQRVKDIFSRICMQSNQNFVVVGGGHLPVTAIHAIEKTELNNAICLDITKETIKSVNTLKQKFLLSGLESVCCDGCDFDYSCADFVYIANMVSPKKEVLDQVLRTVKPGTPIIVREPYSLGNLWAESVVQSIPDPLYLEATGPGSAYLSRDIFLSWV